MLRFFVYDALDLIRRQAHVASFSSLLTNASPADRSQLGNLSAIGADFSRSCSAGSTHRRYVPAGKVILGMLVKPE